MKPDDSGKARWPHLAKGGQKRERDGRGGVEMVPGDT